MAVVVFWLTGAVLLWVYGGYPLLALLVGRLRPRQIVTHGPPPATVTVGVAVHNGERDVEERIADILSQQLEAKVEVIVASDASTDRTVPIVERIAADDGRVRVLALPRVGQSAAQSAIFAASRSEVVVLTDTETRFAPGCLAALVSPFADPTVACATGVLRWRYDHATTTAQHEGLYWRYEQAVRAWESRAGWMTAVTGALLAVRRSSYRPVSAHASLDQLLPLHAQLAGERVLAVAEATGTDRGTSSVGEQFHSRLRIATQGIRANLGVLGRLAPWRRPGPWLAIVSHKLLRWATPWLVVVAASAALVAALADRDLLYLVPPLAIAAVGAWGAGGALLRRRGARLPGSGFPLTLLVINVAFALAWLRVLTRRRSGRWESTGGSRPD